jgi:hypothetical protein
MFFLETCAVITLLEAVSNTPQAVILQPLGDGVEAFGMSLSRGADIVGRKLSNLRSMSTIGSDMYASLSSPRSARGKGASHAGQAGQAIEMAGRKDSAVAPLRSGAGGISAGGISVGRQGSGRVRGGTGSKGTYGGSYGGGVSGGRTGSLMGGSTLYSSSQNNGGRRSPSSFVPSSLSKQQHLGGMQTDMGVLDLGSSDDGLLGSPMATGSDGSRDGSATPYREMTDK